MIQSSVAVTNHPQSRGAGESLGEQIARAFSGEPPDALILMASERYDPAPLLSAIAAACRPRLLVGGSSQGEFTSGGLGDGTACAIALRAPASEMLFSAHLGRSVRDNLVGAVGNLVAGFRGLRSHDYAFRSALVLTDWLAGDSERLLDLLTLDTAGRYQIFGGAVGGDDLHAGHRVFFGTEAIPGAVVALEILSNKPIGIGVCHGWRPASAPMRVTEADGARLVSLNAVSAGDVYRQYAENSGQPFDMSEPLPFFLHNVLGLQSAEGHKLRVPLALNGDGSIECASDVPTGTVVSIMQTSVRSTSAAATIATRAAQQSLGAYRPQVALVLDCVATRRRLGKEYGAAGLDGVRGALDGVEFAGFNSVGQIARAEGQFTGFHNCSALVCVLPS
jgi:hypothetical protein